MSDPVPVLVTFCPRRDTAANFTSVNPVLEDGELARETDTGKVKFGDGSTAWNSLPYSALGGVSSFNGRSGAVTLSYSDVTGALGFTPTSASGAVSAVAAAAGTGLVKSSGSSLSTAVAGALGDYVAPGAVTSSGLTMSPARILARYSTGTGAPQEVSVGRGLSLGASLSVPSVTGYISGVYYLPEGIGLAAAPSAGSSNTIYLHPFILTSDTTIESLFCRVSTAAASGLFQFALYAASATTNLPTGAPLYSSASQSTTSVTNIEDTGPSLSAPAGLYWAATNKDTTAATAVFVSGSVNQFRIMQTIGSQTLAGALTGSGSALTGYSKSQTFGTWPTLTGSFSGDGLAHVQSTIIPVVGFKAG